MKLRYIRNSKYFLGIEIITLIVALWLIFFKGFNYSIDYTGGTLFHIKVPATLTLAQLRADIENIEGNFPALKNSMIQPAGDKEFIIKAKEVTEDEKNQIITFLSEQYKGMDLLEVDKVGASIGKTLRDRAIMAIIVGCILIFLYITFRFEWKFASGAIIALVHDIIIAAGGIALLGYEIDAPFIAAMLTILGYSINDTIVVFDRIRENIRKKTFSTMEDTIDNSINQVFTRSINSSVTTLLAVTAILIFGGATLKTFLVTLLIGIISGTYSSIFVASPIVYILDKIKTKKLG